MTIEETIDWIHSRKKFGSRPGLERVQALLDKAGNPEKQVPVIHIAGTNGKGSTVAYLRSMLAAAGLTVGSFTSPYIEEFNERIAINGEPIADDELITWVERYQPLVANLDEQPEINGITEFEVLTAMALDYFLDQQVDVAIVEVGLGGLLDSTNVVEPILTAITTIGYDHTDILGETLPEIAHQKAGIIKNNIPVVTGNIPTEALTVIKDKAESEQAAIYQYDKDYQVKYLQPDGNWGERFDFTSESGRLSKLKISLLGRHQIENAGIAIILYQLYCQKKHLPVEEKAIRSGLLAAQWPARMEKISDEPLIILDGAHNDHAVKRLVDNMRREFSQYTIHILFSALETKDVDSMLKDLHKIPHAHMYITTFDYPKALNLSQYDDQETEQFSVVSLWQFGLAEILESMDAEDLLLVTGSLYFVSEVRQLLLNVGGSDERN
ncbi:Mur ligase family protein [Candidatus Enterococcus ferrettii]|uniref:tetrahydrofolate synthase n=1 Tax=Candidatus Enterococcus ferrettii TaxID=2815324 RepID=A0ABV0EKB7_9ENTE|nr:bifunctional folylpolyglutamate synthase/dihydrofolate synthase [Enterococcus sp. 665A]